MKWHVLTQDKIDTVYWQNKLATAQVYTAYAQPQFINCTTQGQWLLLHSDDEQLWAPLPLKRKWGLIPYTFQPPFLQQLGLMGRHALPDEEVNFMAQIKKMAWKGNYAWHSQLSSEALQRRPCQRRSNFVVNIPYDSNMWSKNAKRNLIRAKRANIKLVTGPWENVLEWFFSTRAKNLALDRGLYVQILAQLFASSLNMDCLHAIDAQGRAVAGAVFMRYRNCVYWLFSGQTPEGRAVSAMTGLLHQAAEYYAQQGLCQMDMVGSDVPEIARFHKQMGAREEHYFQLKL